MQGTKNRLIFSIISIGMMVFAVAWHKRNLHALSEIALRGSEALHQRLETSKALANETMLQPTSLPAWQSREGIGVYVFFNDSLKWWNNAELPLEGQFKRFNRPAGAVWLETGLYLYSIAQNDSVKCLVASLIKPAFGVKNKYLSNDFKKWTGIPTGISVVPPDKMTEGVAALQLDGAVVAGLKGTEVAYGSAETATWCTVLFIVGCIALLLILLTTAATTAWPVALLVTGSLLALRFAMLYFEWPAFLYDGPLYDVRLYGNAQSFFNGYLGDILFNSLTLLFLVVYWVLVPLKLQPGVKMVLAGVVFMVAAVSFYGTGKTLITNSTLNFDFLGIFNVSPLAFVGLSALCLFSLSLLIGFYVVFEQAQALRYRWPWFISVTGVLVITVATLIIGTTAQSLWFYMYCLVMVLVFSQTQRRGIMAAFHMLLFSLITAQLLTSSIEVNLRNEMEVMADKLSETKDPVFENEFRLVHAAIAKDESIKNLVNILPETAPAITSLLNQKYFNGYFNRYQIRYQLFDQNCHAELPTENPVFLNEGFFEDQVRNFGDSTATPQLFFIQNKTTNDYYIARLAFDSYRLYMYFEPKQMGEAGSFPDLLLDQSQQRHDKIRRFSYGIYRAKQLSEAYGGYDYPAFLNDSLPIDQSGIEHHYFSTNENTEVVISSLRPSFSNDFTFNSYILLFYSLLTWMGYLLYAALFTQEFSASSFTRRVQFTIVFLLLLAISAVAVTSSRLVNSQFEEDNRKQLREKTAFITNELLSSVTANQLFDAQQKDLVNLQLTSLSRLFRTDISLFSVNGQLFNTSQPRLYSLGLAAQLANPSALRLLAEEGVPAVTVEERAGTLKYLSHYTAVFDKRGHLAGFINLPYFAKQNDLVNELSGIISAFINVYVILFVLSLLAGLVLSSYITRPLRYIQQQLARISLAGSNEKIEWQTRDEVGQLVQEYNSMLVKLEESASLLARSERESAWREMAKQVAHEIRNPLTPMKLNLQYLQHLSERDPEVFKERFEKIAAGIIEQIDALATIASEFSSLARLPGTVLTKVALRDSIENAVSLFTESGVVVNIDVPETLYVLGDRDQCLRVFNNVVKNAVQATEQVEQPSIQIRVQAEDEGSVVVVVSDNGCGIDDEVAGKIFTPNFTTKTTGSGLGLAMVKNIMEAFGGSIRFVSKKDKGTEFYIEFRKARLTA
jgi:signal transduction histidine kinase